MVDQSELAFRLLAREHGTELAFTPMLNARLMAHEPPYVPRHFDPHPHEGPLVAQIAGHDPDTLIAAARICEPHIAAVDLNLGCPQAIAERGRYGAFLLEREPERVMDCVRALVGALEVAVTAKMRLQPREVDTLDMALRLQDAGVAALTVHGRTRHQTSQLQGIGAADWSSIHAVACVLDIPVIANGGIASLSDAHHALRSTDVSAVMSGEMLLENPALFCANAHPQTGRHVCQDSLAARYLELCAEHPPPKGIAVVKAHVRKMLHGGWAQWPDLAEELYIAGAHEFTPAASPRLAPPRPASPRLPRPSLPSRNAPSLVSSYRRSTLRPLSLMAQRTLEP